MPTSSVGHDRPRRQGRASAVPLLEQCLSLPWEPPSCVRMALQDKHSRSRWRADSSIGRKLQGAAAPLRLLEPAGVAKPDLAAFSEFPLNGPPEKEKPVKTCGISGALAVGAAALLLEADPDLKPWQVKRILCETTQDLLEPGWDKETGWGLLDARAAVTRALKEKAARDRKNNR